MNNSDDSREDAPGATGPALASPYCMVAVDDVVLVSLAAPLAHGACHTGIAGCRVPLPAGFFGIDWDENLREAARLLCLHKELLRRPHELRRAGISVYEKKATGDFRCLYAYHVVPHIQFRDRANHRSGCIAAHDIGGEFARMRRGRIRRRS